MFDWIVSLLVSAALAAGAAFGAGNATDPPQGGDPEFNSAGAARAVWAKQQAAERRADAEVLVEVESSDAGLATALESLAQAAELAPEEADVGLTQAVTAVSSAGQPEDAGAAGRDAAQAAPVAVPAGPPAEVPAGGPAGVPAGPPAEIPAEIPAAGAGRP